jgi:hypothetical protein
MKNMMVFGAMLVMNDDKILGVCTPHNNGLVTLPMVCIGAEAAGKTNGGTESLIQATLLQTNIKVQTCNFLTSLAVGKDWCIFHRAIDWSGYLASGCDCVAMWVSIDEFLAGAYPECHKILVHSMGLKRR